MSDDFYGPFDQAFFCEEPFNPQRERDYRTVFQQDLGRLMFTGAFRRLQAKTQVFQPGEYDFYRTRLTHSLDVAHIAKSIATWLHQENPAIRVDPDLLEAICLAHDIGHPPFGHAGERVLNEVMEHYGGFEGNAQTLRILTRTIYTRETGRSGMTPTRALLDGVLKYKRLYRDRNGEPNHFIYDDQAHILEFCFGTSDLAAALGTPEVNSFRSLECQIMDMADDIAYSCFDLADGAKAGFISSDKIHAWRERQGNSLEEPQLKHLAALLDMMASNRFPSKMNRVIGELITGTRLVAVENFMTSRTRRHGFRLECEPQAKARIRLHKKLGRELIFGSSAVRQLEFKGGHILKRLANALFDNYLGIKKKDSEEREKPEESELVSSEVHRAVLAETSEATKARLLCDHLSGMTDAYALRSYKRLFDPDYGSISELI